MKKPWRWTKLRKAYRWILSHPEEAWSVGRLKGYVETQVRKIGKEDNWLESEITKQINLDFEEINEVAERLGIEGDES